MTGTSSARWAGQAVEIDIGLIQWIESVLCVDCGPSRDEVEVLHRRVQAHYDEYSDPENDAELVADTNEALDGGWLRLYEIRPIQQLRGWHRLRYGNVTVSRDTLREVTRVLDGLTISFGSECDGILSEYDLDSVGPPPRHPCPERYWQQHVAERAAILKSMTTTGFCGECTWCQMVSLRDQCEAILHPAKEAA